MDIGYCPLTIDVTDSVLASENAVVVTTLPTHTGVNSRNEATTISSANFFRTHGFPFAHKAHMFSWVHHRLQNDILAGCKVKKEPGFK